MSGLECKNISKSYKDNKVLDNVSLNIEQGKIYGLIGRNGVGKTTLMSIMTGQNPADSGDVTYNGQPVWENAEALSHICFSREINTKSLLGMNNQKVKEYLRLASIYYKNWDKDMAEELVKRFGIDKKKKVCNLSKGMLSMLTVIIGLASKAEITILDEPAAGLDVIVREEFYKLIIDEQQENGRTFIISTHIIEEAANVFEEVIILKDKCVYLKENTVELLDKCRYVSGLEEDVKIPKTSISVLCFAAYRICKDKKSFEKFALKVSKFLATYDDNTEYKNNLMNGTNSAESVRFRLDYWRNIIRELQ